MNNRTAGLGITLGVLAFMAGLLFFTGNPDNDPADALGFDSRSGMAIHETKASIVEAFGKSPLRFEANDGQTDEQVRFLSRGPGYTLFLTPNEFVVSVTGAAPDSRDQSSPDSGETRRDTDHAVLRIGFADANPMPQLTATSKLSSYSNYYIGDDRTKWRTNVPHYARVHYEEVYPGIDVVAYGNQGQLEYDFVVAPGGDPANIAMTLNGADKIEIENGDLVAHIAKREFRLTKPLIYQDVDSTRREVDGSFVLAAGNRVGFQVANYDRALPLVIDPFLLYATYLGGDDAYDEGLGIAVNAAGEAHIVGITSSDDFPDTTGSGPVGGVQDIFVTKLAADGSALVFSTFLGGSGNQDTGAGIDLDDATGDVYVTGHSDSQDFPTTAGAYQENDLSLGFRDGFLTRLDDTGILDYSTYLGATAASGSTWVTALRYNQTSGEAIVVGFTQSTVFPTTGGAFDTTHEGTNDGFVAVIDPDKIVPADQLVYSTYVGGSGIDEVTAVDVDASSGEIHFVGYTDSADFPTVTDAYDEVFGPKVEGSWEDVFYAVIDPAAGGPNDLNYGTYLGGDSDDRVTGIALDSSSRANIVGYSWTNVGVGSGPNSFPTTAGSYDETFNGGYYDSFLAIVNPDVSVVPASNQLVYSSWIGGTSADRVEGIALDNSNNVYLTGQTLSANFPKKDNLPALEGTIWDAFALVLNPAGGGAGDLVFSTVFGGDSTDIGEAVAVNDNGSDPVSMFITGRVSSDNFPATPGAFQETDPDLAGSDAFVARIQLVGDEPPGPGEEVTYQTVVLIGDPAPVGEAFTGNFRDPVINNKGSFALGANTTEGGCGGIYNSINNVFSKVLCEEGLSQETKVLTEKDNLAFSALGPQIYTDLGGLHSVVGGVFSSNPVPGFEDELFELLGQPRLNDDGLISFWGRTDKTQTAGIWQDVEGTLGKLVAEGDEAPVLSGSAAFTAIGQNNLVISHNADTGFVATTDDSPGTGVWSVDKSTAIRKVIAPGDTAPGSIGLFVSAGDLDNNPSHVPSINRRGEVALRGTTDNAGESGVWAERWNETTLSLDLHNVILAGTVVDPITGWTPTTFDTVAVNDIGNVAFRGCSAAPNACGIVLASWDETAAAYGYAIIALESSAAGAAPDPLGAPFVQIDAANLVLNAASQVAFQALAATPDKPGGVMGIWGWDPETGLHRVILTGDNFEIAKGDIRTIADSSLGNLAFTTTGGGDGRPSVLNDQKQLVFTAFFEEATPFSEAVIIATIPGALVHEIIVTSGPESNANPTVSRSNVDFTVTVEDSFGHDLSYAWDVDCSAWSDDDGVFRTSSTEQYTRWGAPTNMTGEFQHCLVRVTINGSEGLSEVAGFVQTVAAEPVPGTLVVTPEDDFLAQGTKGGARVPASKRYVIRNIGDEPIVVQVLHHVDWISLSPTDNDGKLYVTTLDPAASENVDLLLNNIARAQEPGGYFAFVSFANVTNGIGSTERRVSLSQLDADGHGIIITVLPIATPSPSLPGGEVQLHVEATDTRGHPLNYSWTQGGCSRGSFDDRRRRSPTWSYPDRTTCTLKVRIDDGLGGVSAEASIKHEILPHIGNFTVTPDADIEVFGPVGGPFFPPLLTYLVENDGTKAVKIDYSFDKNWIWDPFSRDNLDPGEFTSRNFSINENGRALSRERYTGTLRFEDDIGPFAPTLQRTINLNVNDVTGCARPMVTAPPDLYVEATARFSDIDLDPGGVATANDPKDGALTPVPGFAGPFRVRTHTVTWGVVNSCGNVDTDTQTLTVRDTTPPVFTMLPVDIALEANGPKTYVDLGTVTAEDLVDPDVEITHDGPTDKMFAPGSHTVTWTARDNNGKKVTAEQTITIRQTVKLIAMEVVQVSQDLDNSVPLIEGKPTLVRAYFEPFNLAPTATFNPILTVTSNGQSQLLLPANYGGYSATSTWWPLREAGSSADYLMPVGLADGNVEFRIDVFESYFDLICDQAIGSLSLRDDCSLSVDFEPAPAPFELAVVSAAYHRGEGDPTFEPSSQDLLNQLKRIYAQLPINDINYFVRFLDLGEKPGTLGISAAISQLRRDDGCKGFTCTTFYYGVVVSDGNFGAGGQGYMPGRSSWGAVANGDSGLRFVSGQEIGHNLGLDHTLWLLTPVGFGSKYGRGPCNAPITEEIEPFFPFINMIDGGLTSTLGPLDAGETGWIYGWDSDRDRVISPFDHFDTMSYCGLMWPSSFTYARWRDAIFAIFPPISPAVVTASLSSDSTLSSQLADGPHLLVRGFIADETHEASFFPFLAIDSADAGDDVPGEHILQALDEFGTILHEIAFEPARLEITPTEPGVPHPTGDRHFSLAVPITPDLFEIRILEDGIVLGAITASQSAPTVDVVFPNGGEVLAGETVTVEWDAQDAHSDPLTFNVQFSPDNGTSWIALAVDHEETFLDVDLNLLPGTDNGIIRVVASDGFWSALDTSDFVFSTPNTPPMMAILSPNQHQVYAGGQTVVFKTLSQDVEDGSLAPENIEWFSDLDTDPLGTGPDLDLSAVGELPAGDHQITVVGTDSDGGTGEDSVRIIVLGGAAPAVFVTHVATSPSRLWPPNKKMVPVTVTPEAMVSPVLDPPDCEITDVASNEPDGDKKNDKFTGDWTITGPLTVDLRAERKGGASGREYAITVECSTTDLDGVEQFASEIGMVTVPTKDE